LGRKGGKVGLKNESAKDAFDPLKEHGHENPTTLGSRRLDIAEMEFTG
jgi:hypothetical protein